MENAITVRRPHSSRARNYPNSIHHYRTVKNLTLAQVAAVLGVTPQAVRQAEVLGVGLKRYDQWLLLCEMFGCSAAELETPRSFLPPK